MATIFPSVAYIGCLLTYKGDNKTRMDTPAINRKSELNTKLAEARNAMVEVIVGQENLIDRILIALLAKGHILLEGVPGLAKTKTVKTFAQVCQGEWQRVQFTPDLMPSDITGTRIWVPGKGDFATELGPVYTNFLLADEINRASAKVQSALLQAMEERQITIGKQTYTIEEPFMVLATQNPIESEGTYILPAAQLDRFIMKVNLSYPTKTQEIEVLRRYIVGDTNVDAFLNLQDVLDGREMVKAVHVPKDIAALVVNLVQSTRNIGAIASEWSQAVIYGAGVRGSLALIAAAQARAFTKGRDEVVVGDIADLAEDTLAHRICISYKGSVDNVTANKVVERIVKTVLPGI